MLRGLRSGPVLLGPPVDRRRSYLSVGCSHCSGTPQRDATEDSNKIMQKIHGAHPMRGTGRGRRVPTAVRNWVLRAQYWACRDPAPHSVPRTKCRRDAQSTRVAVGTLPPRGYRSTTPGTRSQTASPRQDTLASYSVLSTLTAYFGSVRRPPHVASVHSPSREPSVRRSWF
jgi:hypothetical protein